MFDQSDAFVKMGLSTGEPINATRTGYQTEMRLGAESFGVLEALARRSRILTCGRRPS